MTITSSPAPSPPKPGLSSPATPISWTSRPIRASRSTPHLSLSARSSQHRDKQPTVLKPRATRERQSGPLCGQGGAEHGRVGPTTLGFIPVHYPTASSGARFRTQSSQEFATPGNPGRFTTIAGRTWPWDLGFRILLPPSRRSSLNGTAAENPTRYEQNPSSAASIMNTVLPPPDAVFSDHGRLGWAWRWKRYCCRDIIQAIVTI